MRNFLKPLSQRRLALLCQAVLVLSPFLALGGISLVTGHSALQAQPVWADEVDTWRALYNWNAVGFSAGYSGMFEAVPAQGALGVQGLSPILLYGWFVKLFGLFGATVPLCNAVWISLGALCLCALLRPRPLASLGIAALTCLYVPLLLYALTSMPELFNYGVLLFYAAFYLRYLNQRGGGWLALACLCAALACAYRAMYGLMFLPLAWAFGGNRLNLKSLLAALVGGLLAAGCYLWASAYASPYPQGFLYHFLRAQSPALGLQMLLSHTKSNLADYFAFYKVDGIQRAFRMLYLISMGVCLIAAFVGGERRQGKWKPRLRLNGSLLCAFLWLASAFALVQLFSETLAWVDFRMLAPILWLTPVCLCLRGHTLVPATLLAGCLALFLGLCLHAPLGSFADPERFSPPEADASLSEAAELIVYEPQATDPFRNAVRTDLSDPRPLMGLAPGIGLECGWFTEENVGQSRWILTDTLKMALEGYEPVYREHGVALYRRLEPDDAP